MSVWEITFVVESGDSEHMTALSALARQYLCAAMNHTRRHDAKLLDMRLERKEEPHAVTDSSA